MNKILARVKGSINEYQILKDGIDVETIYGDIERVVQQAEYVKYDYSTILDEDMFFYIDKFSKQKYYPGFLKESMDSSVQYANVTKESFIKVNLVIIYKNVVDNGGYIIFQKVLPSKVLTNAKILCFKTDDVVILESSDEIVLNDVPDAIYDIKKDRLIFKKLEKLTTMFDGIESLLRVATDPEVKSFLSQDFVKTSNSFTVDKVKESNRKRISIVNEIIKNLGKNKIKRVVNYIKDYCNDLTYTNGKFELHNDKDLKNLLFGIQEKYYTTEITGKKRCANSVIDIN